MPTISLIAVSMAAARQLASTGFGRLVPSDVARSNALAGVNELQSARRERDEVEAFLAAYQPRAEQFHLPA